MKGRDERPRWRAVARLLSRLRRLPHPVRAFIVTRGILLVVCAVAPALPADLFAFKGHGYPLRLDGDVEVALPSVPALDGWARWDSAWYGAIAREGYGARMGEQSATAYFPLYPLAALAASLPVRAVLPNDEAFYLAGIVLSHAAFLAALLAFHRLARQDLSEDAARRATWLLCCFPFSFFFGAVYTEALFLALCVSGFLLARRGRWWAACAVAALAALTRNVGMFLGPALALEYLRQRDYDWRRIDRTAAAFCLPPCGTLAYAAYLGARFGDPLKFVHAQKAWGHKLALPPLGEMIDIVGRDGAAQVRLMMGTYLLFIVAFPALAVLVWRRYGAPLGLFAIAMTAPPLMSGLYFGLGRYMAVVFPVFFLAGELEWRRGPLLLACASGFAMSAAYLIAFSRWGPPV